MVWHHDSDLVVAIFKSQTEFIWIRIVKEGDCWLADFSNIGDVSLGVSRRLGKRNKNKKKKDEEKQQERQ